MADKQKGAEAPKRAPKTPEQKAETFRQVGAKRTVNVLKAVKRLGKLANPRSYAFTEEHVNAMFTAIRKDVDAAEAHYRDVLAGKKDTAAEPEFVL